jgi:hypothetical protein
MPGPFVIRFVLPLVKGGILRVGGPVGWPSLGRILRRLPQPASGLWESPAADEVAQIRQTCAAQFGPADEPLRLDEPSLRLAAAAHNLLLLGHPELAGREREQERVAELARQLADLGPPNNPAEAVSRYSLLARLPETVRVDHQVAVGPTWLRFELHKNCAVPTRTMRALVRLTHASVQARRRAWWKEIGFPTCADRAVATLFRACPLLEAMDPMRLHPALSWRRILPVLRFPALARAVASRVLDLGCEAAGSALASALLSFASLADEDGSAANGEEIAFAIRFVAHVFWLDQLFGAAGDLAPNSDLAALLAAATEVEPRLLWPPDIARDREPGQTFARRLQPLCAETPSAAPDRYRAMRSLCALAAGPRAA